MKAKMFLAGLFVAVCCLASAQTYVLKDHRPDTTKKVVFTYDSLPDLCDSFFKELPKKSLASIPQFVPTVNHLKELFDTLDVEYNLQGVVTKQQLMLRSLQRDYKKILKRVKKKKVRFKSMEISEKKLDYGVDESGRGYCYVTLHCKRKKSKYDITFVALQLNGKWFMADNLRMIWVE